MINKILILILFISLQSVFSQTLHQDKEILYKKYSADTNINKVLKIKDKKTTVWQDLKNDGIIFATDLGAYAISPFRMDGREWLWAAGLIGTTALAMQIDLKGKDWLDRGTSETFNKDFWDGPTIYGFVQYPALGAGALYLSGLAVRNNWLRITGRLWLEALAYSGGAVMLLRYVTGRYRPYYTDNPFKFSWFQTSNDTQSFPSGHTVVAFASSTILAHRISNIFVSIGLYAIAGLTAYARLINNQHWISDVIAGAALGFASGLFVMNREWNREEEINKKVNKKTKGGKAYYFYPTLSGIGLTLKL